MRQTMKKSLAWVKRGANIRENPGTEEELRRLGESYKKRPVHPLIAHLDGTAIDCWRRVLGLRLIGETEAEFLITDEVLSPADIAEICMVTAIHKKTLDGYEMWQGCDKMLAVHPEWQQKDLAAHLDLDAGMITRLRSPGKCIPAWQEALRAGQVTIEDCYRASRLDGQQQQELLAMKLSGSSAAEVVHQARKARYGHKETVKVGKLRCPMRSGAVVQVNLGGDGGIQEAIEAVHEWLKEAKRALEQGLDAKTFERVCKDKAARGE